MGNVTITIKLVGHHHNSMDTDAERMAAKFVEHLKVAGHNVTHAGVTHGGEQDVLAGEASLGPAKIFTGQACSCAVENAKAGKPVAACSRCSNFPLQAT